MGLANYYIVNITIGGMELYVLQVLILCKGTSSNHLSGVVYPNLHTYMTLNSLMT